MIAAIEKLIEAKIQRDVFSGSAEDVEPLRGEAVAEFRACNRPCVTIEDLDKTIEPLPPSTPDSADPD